MSPALSDKTRGTWQLPQIPYTAETLRCVVSTPSILPYVWNGHTVPPKNNLATCINEYPDMKTFEESRINKWHYQISHTYLFPSDVS